MARKNPIHAKGSTHFWKLSISVDILDDGGDGHHDAFYLVGQKQLLECGPCTTELDPGLQQASLL